MKRTRAIGPMLPAGAAVFVVTLVVLATACGGGSGTTIEFRRGELQGAGFAVHQPTTLAFGPDGRLYVAQLDGAIFALTLDPDSKAVTAVQQVATDADFEDVLGIAFSPVDPPDPVTLYVSTTLLNDDDDTKPYQGRVARLVGPEFTEQEDIITGLPSSDHIHGTNGLAFDAEGRLYIQQGSMTNAGIAGPMGGDGDRAETPLSGATLVADIYAPGFDGQITYDQPNATGPTVNQTGGDVRVFASGMRNPYDIVVHSNGFIYGTDNGPNNGHDGASSDCDTVGEDPWQPDELNLIIEGQYYGHPNRNRGRMDPRQCIYHVPEEEDGTDFTKPIAILNSSSNGITEYRADAFEGALRGNLLYTWFVPGAQQGELRRLVLSEDGRAVESDGMLADGILGALDVAVGPDGTVYVAAFDGAGIVFLAPM